MIRLTILGEPASKANSRKLVVIGGMPRIIKGEKALAYEKDALRQIPPKARQRLEGPVRVTMRIFYASERPDLDESLILDCLQDRFGKGHDEDFTPERQLVQAGVYRNDRQVRERHTYHAIDKKNPRAEIVVEPLPEDQPALPLAVEEHADVAQLRKMLAGVVDEQDDVHAVLDRINAALCGI
jgi:Holliday junction resolvase RusA-like endonuclease